MDISFYLIAAVVVLSLIFVIYFLKKSNEKREPVHGDQVRGPAQREAVVAGGVRRRANRMRRARQDSESSDEEADFEHVAIPDGKIGAKKLRKLQDKEERRRQREAELQEREEKKERDKLLEEQRIKEEKRRAVADKEQEEIAKKLKEEEEARELEEYLKLKATFEIEEEGTQEAELNEDTESLLQKFISYIQEMKVIMLEDLAAHFNIRTQDCIDRINTLQEEGRLSGVMDDRGKFIYITDDEYQAVAKFIKQRGRVSITELAEHSNKLINLNPDNKETHAKLLTQIS